MDAGREGESTEPTRDRERRDDAEGEGEKNEKGERKANKVQEDGEQRQRWNK